MIKNLLVIPLCCLFVLSCSSEKQDWAIAETENTITAYEMYLEQHPQGDNAGSANAKIEELVWQSTKTEDTVEGYETYLKRYATGQYADSAKLFITEHNDWTIVENANATAAHKAFLEKYPEGKYVGRAKWALAALEAASNIDPVKLYRENVVPYGRSKLLTIFDPQVSGRRVELSYKLENGMEEHPVLMASFTEANIAAQTSSFYYYGRGYTMSENKIRFSPAPHGGWVRGKAKVTIYLIMADDTDFQADELLAVSNVVSLYMQY